MLTAFGEGVAQTERVEHVSMIQLICNADQWHGQKVLISGILHYKFEDSALYLTLDHANHLDGRNGVWVSYAPELLKSTDPLKLDGRFVSIVGTFNKDRRGHMGAFPGTIENVTSLSADKKYYND